MNKLFKIFHFVYKKKLICKHNFFIQNLSFDKLKYVFKNLKPNRGF